MKTPWWFTRKTPLAFLLVPVSWIYYGAGRVVYGMRRMGQIKSRRPIICVGNILAGGVGKTPIVREIAKFLDAPVVMRGYKKRANRQHRGRSDHVGGRAFTGSHRRPQKQRDAVKPAKGGQSHRHG